MEKIENIKNEMISFELPDDSNRRKKELIPKMFDLRLNGSIPKL